MFDAGKLRFGRVVGYRWIVIAGSWGWSRLVDRYSRLWRYVGLTKGVSIRLLARTAGRTWVRCCSGRAVRNSESLCGLCYTLQERRGRGKARALPGPLAVRTYRTGAKALSGQSRADESDGSEGLSCQSRADERTGAKALSCQSRVDEQTGQEAEAKMGVILALRR